MISKARLQFIRSLHQKKHRLETALFFVEGEKNVLELLNSAYEIEALYCTESFLHKNKVLKDREFQITLATPEELVKAGTFEVNQAALALAKIPKALPALDFNSRILALNGIRDPGNLGTIVRTADWFGISQIVCSTDCVEFWNPKVLNATMGSFARICPYEIDLESFMQENKHKAPILLADMEGQNPYLPNSFSSNGILVMGSEAHGHQPWLKAMAFKSLSIPRFGKAESLNVGIAAGILMGLWVGEGR